VRTKISIRNAAVIAAAVGLTLTACSQGGGESTDKLEAITQRGQINIGSCLGTPPYGMLDDSGNPAGFDIDLANELGEFLDVKVTITDLNSNGRIPALQSGVIDLVSCNFTITDERREQVDFSDVVMYSGNSLLVREDSGITSLDDLAGKTVAVTKGGTNVAVAEKYAPEATQQAYENLAAAVLALKQGQVDSVIELATSVTAAAANNPELVVAVDGEVGPKAEFGLAVQKGQEKLLAKTNKFLEQFHATGRGSELFEEWAGYPATFQFEGLEG
jgi:polar amino acid transport system substrate-binding protein